MIQPVFRNPTAHDTAAHLELGSRTGPKREGFGGPPNIDPLTLISIPKVKRGGELQPHCNLPPGLKTCILFFLLISS